MQEKILKFELTHDKPFELHKRFYPNGVFVLNRTIWHGKEPKSCSITGFKSRPSRTSGSNPLIFDIEVAYRPKGCITYHGNTRYDGWKAIMLDRDAKGTLLDGHGQPLREGEPPVYRESEMFGDAEFNDIDFGKFIGEFDVPNIKHINIEAVMQELKKSDHFNVSIAGVDFMVPLRSKPSTKIVISSQPSGVVFDGFGTRIIVVNNDTPHIEQVLMDHLINLISDVLAGRASVKSVVANGMMMIVVSDALVDSTPSDHGMKPWFDVLKTYVPLAFLDDLAQRLMAIYEVDVSVVDGSSGGLLIRREQKK